MSMTKAGLNQPWSVQIELTEGCTRLCKFCGLNGIRNKPGEDWRFMEWKTARKISGDLHEFCPEARLEFAMHGEPLLNPEHEEILALFRAVLPKAQIQVTTNGQLMQGKMEEKALSLFRSGVDFILLDTYRPERSRLRAEAKAIKKFSVVDLYADWAPKKISPYQNFRRRVRNTIIMVDDISLRDGELASRVIMNHCGNNPLKPLPPEPLQKTCTNPFRELSICYDGEVCICCMDFGHEYVCGNVNVEKLYTIWYGKAFQSARTFLRNKMRLFTPCSRCDAPSGARSGLLPRYDLPTQKDKNIVRETVMNGKPRNQYKPAVLF